MGDIMNLTTHDYLAWRDGLEHEATFIRFGALMGVDFAINKRLYHKIAEDTVVLEYYVKIGGNTVGVYLANPDKDTNQQKALKMYKQIEDRIVGSMMGAAKFDITTLCVLKNHQLQPEVWADLYPIVMDNLLDNNVISFYGGRYDTTEKWRTYKHYLKNNSKDLPALPNLRLDY